MNTSNLLNVVDNVNLLRNVLRNEYFEPQRLAQRGEYLEKEARKIFKDLIGEGQTWESALKDYLEQPDSKERLRSSSIDNLNESFLDFQRELQEQIQIEIFRDDIVPVKPHGVIYNDVPDELDINIDPSDLDFVALISDPYSFLEISLNAPYKIQKYPLSKEMCRQFGIDHPATCYAGYHA